MSLIPLNDMDSRRREVIKNSLIKFATRQDIMLAMGGAMMGSASLIQMQLIRTGQVDFMQLVKNMDADQVSELTIYICGTIQFGLKNGKEMSTVDSNLKYRFDLNYIRENYLNRCENSNIIPDRQHESSILLNYAMPITCSLQTQVFQNVQKEIKNIQNKIKESFATQNNIKFKDIIGNNEAKEELQDIINYFKNINDHEHGINLVSKGILLHGPTGTGKTSLAKATACESNINFIQKSGAEFVEMQVGVGSKRVRDLFEEARDMAPCIVFIDEIDAIGTRRNTDDKERAATLNQLLTEMDGFNQRKDIVILAATNCVHELDPALKRAGRFDAIIKIELPSQEERVDILRKYLNKFSKENDVSNVAVEKVAQNCEGFAGSDLESIVLMAYRKCCKRSNKQVQDLDFLDSFNTYQRRKLDSDHGRKIGIIGIN